MIPRFPGLVVQDWRTRLIVDHPRLFPDARLVRGLDGPVLSCIGRLGVPDGWRRILEIACRRLDDAVAGQPGGEVIVAEATEKFGTLRLSVCAVGLHGTANDAVSLAVDLAEARSEHVCDRCGRPGRLRSDLGWFSTKCDDHAGGTLPVRQPDAGVQIVTRYVDGVPFRTARRYVPDRDAFVVVPVPVADHHPGDR